MAWGAVSLKLHVKKNIYKKHSLGHVTSENKLVKLCLLPHVIARHCTSDMSLQVIARHCRSDKGLPSMSQLFVTCLTCNDVQSHVIASLRSRPPKIRDF